MTNRSANAAIKGYFYQFDHTIMHILSATRLDATITVEGIEDIDLLDGDETTLVQCKYYEGTDYNHSAIRDAVINLLRHYHSNGCRISNKFKYSIYGHYKSGQEKLPAQIDTAFLKEKFLTYRKNGRSYIIHDELQLDDQKLEVFISVLRIDLRADAYSQQQENVGKLISENIAGCQGDDAHDFYYPIAFNIIQKLAVSKNESDRKITKAQFLSTINKKEDIFNTWLHRKFGDDYYVRLLRKKIFPSRSLKMTKMARIFVIDVTGDFNVANTATLVSKIGTTFSHKEHRHTPVEDRFCPFLLLRGVNRSELIALKTQLRKSGIKFSDGHEFDGSDFSAQSLTEPVTKGKLVTLKFIPAIGQLSTVIELINGVPVEIFDFFKNSPIASDGTVHHKIKIDSISTISEVLK